MSLSSSYDLANDHIFRHMLGASPPPQPARVTAVNASDYTLDSLVGDGTLTAIRQAITASDTAALRRAAHTLKGSIRHFGETDAFEHACRLEMMGEDGNLGNAEETLAALEREMEWVVQALSEYVQRNGTADHS